MYKDSINYNVYASKDPDACPVCHIKHQRRRPFTPQERQYLSQGVGNQFHYFGCKINYIRRIIEINNINKAKKHALNQAAKQVKNPITKYFKLN